MAFFRRTFSRRLLPDRFQEITERVYVFDCCLSTKELTEQDYKSYMDTAVTNLQRHHPGASFMVFNLKGGDDPSLLSDLLSHHDMTVIDYPRHYEGYPILPLEMIHYFLRSSDSWLSLEGQRNVILMHCERGGWPALAFMLAGLLLYSKKQVGELKTLEMVLKQAPKELWAPLSIMNPRPSQLRYLQYISNRSLTSEWPPSDAPLVVESLLLMNLPLFDGGKGCRPVLHVYGQDSSMRSSGSPRLLCTSLMSEEGAHYYKKEECLMVKINLNCRVQGDVFVECIHLGDDLVSEEKIFKVMFHTAFVQSYIMLLTSSDVDVLWNATAKIPNDFKAEVFFSNPEEVQLSIAKELASLESGHESESEFFEAEEFGISAGDNLADHHNEDKQGKSVVKSTEDQDPEANFDDKENKKHKVEATEHQEQNLEQAPISGYEPIHNASDERDSYQVTEAGLHPSGKSGVLDDYEQEVTKESIFGVSGSNKVEGDTSQTTLSIGYSEQNYDLKQAKAESDFGTCVIKSDSILVDVAKQSQEDGSEKASSQVLFEANTDGVLIEECSKDVSTSASIEARPSPNDEIKSFLLLEESKEGSLEAPSKDQFGGVEDFSKASSPLEVGFVPNIVADGSDLEPIVVVGKSIMVTGGSEDDDSNTAITKSTSKTYILVEERQNTAETTSDEPGLELNSASKSSVEDKLQDCSTAESKSINIEVEGTSEQDFSKASPLEVRFEPNTVAKGSSSEPNVVVAEDSEIGSKVVSRKHTSETSRAFSLELSQEITKPTSSEADSGMAFLVVEESLEYSSRAEVEEKNEQDFSKASPLEVRFEPNMVVEGSESEPITVSKNIVVTEESETGFKPGFPQNTNETRTSSENMILLEASQATTKATSDKSPLVVEENLEYSSRAGAESNVEAVEVRSEQDSSEVYSSEMESESCVMSKSFISIEGSEDSSEAASSQTGTEFLVAQATSSEAKPAGLISSSSKHIVVMTEDDKEHDVKVQVQPRVGDGGPKGVVVHGHQRVKNKKKPRLADAVAKVTMQKRVISMWVPRDKQSNPEDTKPKAAPAYKWVPKESVSASEEEEA